MGALPEIRESAVVESAAHSQTVTVRVEADQWDQDQIQCPGEPQMPPATARLWDPQAIGPQRGIGGIGQEPQTALPPGAQYRQ
jgi:hypothetical protein